MKRSFAFAILSLLVAAMAAYAIPPNIQPTTVAYWGFNEQAPGWQVIDGVAPDPDPVVDGGWLGNVHQGYIRPGQDGVDEDQNPILITPYYTQPWSDPQAALHLNAGAFNEPTDGMGPNYKQDHVVINQDTQDFNLMLGDLQDYTMEACIKTSETGYQVLMTKRFHNEWEPPANGIGWVFRLDDGKPALYYQTATNSAYPDPKADISVADGQWHHIAMVIDANADPAQTSVSFYVDEVLHGTTLLSAINWPPGAYVNENIVNNYDLWIGDQQGRHDDQFIGDIDGMAFSNAALTPGTGPGHFVLSVPEPSSIVLLIAGALALIAVRRVR